MAKVSVGKLVSDTPWGEVDKSALGRALAARFAAGEASRAVIREAYAFVPAEAFGKDGEGAPSFVFSKGWGPHHELRGDVLVVNRGGVIGAAQALAGARSEPSLDAAAMAQAKQHIRRHYRALKMDAPASLQESGPGNPADCGTAPLEELTKGSLEYAAEHVRAAFRQQFEPELEVVGHYLGVEECFADYVIVRDGELPEDEYWRVTFSQDADGVYVFADREEWELVELAYQAPTSVPTPAPVPSPVATGEGGPGLTMAEGRGEAKPRKPAAGSVRFVERLAVGVELVESNPADCSTGGGLAAAGQSRRIRGVGITADVVNGNQRRYPAQVLAAAVAELQGHLHESAGQGRLVPVLGEVEHPSDKSSGRPNLLETVVRWSNVMFDGRQVLLEGVLLETAKGKDLLAVLAGGVRPGLSQRGYGRSRVIDEAGQRVEEVTELTITGYDVVMEPSDPEAEAEMVESRNPADCGTAEGDETMDAEKLAELIKANPGLFKGVVAESVKEMTDAQRAALEEQVRKALGVDGSADLGKALTEAAAALRQVETAAKAKVVAEAVEAACKELPYGKALNETFVTELRESVQEAAEVAGRAATLRKRYDQVASVAKLAGMGRVQVVGPVLEGEMGVPEYARHSHELTEALVRTGYIQPWDSRKPKNRNEQLAAKYLEKFDKQYARELRKEAAEFAEAEAASGLNIPYGVSRTILAAVWPSLVATGLFDVDTTDKAPMRVYYEVFAGESGKHATITRENLTTSRGVFVSLAHKRLEPGTVTVENSANNVTYTEGTNYVIDYTNGALKELATIGDSTVCHVSYHYDALREGEGVAIQQAKMTLSYGLMDVQADRLATQINNEAVVFARAQLGWDATTRTLVNLINEVRRRIDADLMFDALSAALGVASNSGGTWTAASDPIIDLVSYVGLAKDKIAKRYYTPTGILISSTNGDKLANWDGFTAAGKRPDADLTENGYLGRLKGLPVFTSTEFSDGYVLVFNRQMVIHRVYLPMAMKGPFPTYDQASAKLVAADQWYAEEYNGTLVPVAEKAATVRVA